jgi:hypothetical protein
VNSVPSVAKAPEKARSFTHRLQAMVADRSDHCLNRGRNRNRDRNRFPFWLAPGPYVPLKLGCRVVSAPQQYPVLNGRIPSRVPSIPIPTPTPILLRHRPFRTTAGEKSPATEVTENTEAHVFSYLNATRLK